MEIVIAPDKFKGTLTAAEAAGAIADGIDRAARRAGRTDVRLILKPMADGGEGSLGILAGDEGEYHPVETFDALMRPVQSAYAVLPGNSGKYAAVEAASAVGLYRLDRGERNPLRTTSYGVGKVMREAIEAGCTELIAAVGGTATSDCGAGMLAALGCRFLDGQNRLIDYPAGGDLIRFDAIDTAPLYHLTQGCRFKVLCDVDNPLTGPKGAAAVFAPQKGADAAAVALL
ncbi:MAG TPA: glycerate kinase, partial [Alistipes sp.]|nr:glycerate kinase [Alistipes sp.]